MHERCSVCDTKFEREPGFFLGSIYFNYGLTALAATLVYAYLFVNRLTSGWVPQASLLAFVVIFPIIFHRHARSLWLGFDQWHDPQPNERG